MTATNHYITGVAIATLIPNPAVALPLALLSHFVLDALPHFGDSKYHQKLRAFALIWLSDFIILISMLCLTLLKNPWWYALAGFLGTSPDLAWIYRFYFVNKNVDAHTKNMNWINKFHNNIQKFEFRGGMLVEIPFAIALTLVLINKGTL
jgi:hypothetical protein